MFNSVLKRFGHKRKPRPFTEFCHRRLLLEKGCTIAIGPPQVVVSSCLNEARSRHITDASSRPVGISKVTVRSGYGECTQFQSGRNAWIDVELRTRARCSKLSLTLYNANEEHQSLFDTSNERLGHGNFTLEDDDFIPARLSGA